MGAMMTVAGRTTRKEIESDSASGQGTTNVVGWQPSTSESKCSAGAARVAGSEVQVVAVDFAPVKSRARKRHGEARQEWFFAAEEEVCQSRPPS